MAGAGGALAGALARARRGAASLEQLADALRAHGGVVLPALVAILLVLAVAPAPAHAETPEAAAQRLHAIVSAGGADEDTWWQLGCALRESGDLAGAEAAFLAALRLDPKHGRTLRDLGRLYNDANRAGEALPLLEDAVAAAPRDREARDALSYALYQTGDAVRSFRVAGHGSPLTRAHVRPLLEAAAFYLEWSKPEPALRALAAARELAPDHPDVSEAFARLYEAQGKPELARAERDRARPPAGASRPAGKDAPAGAPPALLATPVADRLLGTTGAGRGIRAGVLVALLVGLRFLVSALRGTGDLAVAIEYPQERRGSFTVRISKRPTRARRRKPDATSAGSPAPEPARASTRFEHTLVTRDTQFRGISGRRWWVVVEGAITDADGGGPGQPVREEQAVRVERGRVAQLRFDLRPKECPVEVSVVRGGTPAAKARVGLRGQPASLRYTREGRSRFGLAPGSYVLVVGSGDRVVERPLELRSLEPQRIVIDVASDAGAVFTGCEGAVDAYLQGDHPAAAKALEREGKHAVARLLRAEHHRQRGELAEAAALYERAGRFGEAAELFVGLGEVTRAAALFEQAGDPVRAAELHRAAGELVKAGDAYAAGEEFASAADCYREANAISQLLGVLEKGGAFLSAGELALEQGQLRRAIRNLEQIELRDADYQKGRELLARAFSQEGQMEKAIEVLEELQHRDPTHPDLAQRIESLRQQVTARRFADAPGGAAGAGSRAGAGASRYEVLEEIGRGGMGLVYKARDKRLGRTVALKRLPDTLKDHPKAVELFLREARAVAALNHPNIVTIHDVDEDGGLYFLTMELLEGVSLRQVIERRGRLTAADLVRLGAQIATGLQYAHERSIVHRDIKPANLFFTRDRIVKIMDFGIAKMVENVSRGTTVIGGTPSYMAPEQATGENVDPRADLYALGATLYELATGEVPFADGDVAWHHRNTPPPDPRERAPELPEALAALIVQLLAKRPDDRPASAAEVKARLDALLPALRAAPSA